jgi:hypothetical protein
VANSLQDAITKVAGGKLPWDLSDPAQVRAGIQDKLVAARDALSALLPTSRRSTRRRSWTV